MKPVIVSIWLFCLTALASYGQYQNRIHRTDFRSAQVYPTGNPLGYPLIGLRSGEVLEFHFDEMTTALNTYNYAAIHCTHDWQKSDLDASEYLQGFPSQSITEYEASFNTQHEYVHHRFSFPNDMMSPRYSGNYLIVVFEGSDASDEAAWILSYRVVIYETLVNVNATATGSALIAERYKKQDVDFYVDYENFTIIDPSRDLHVNVIQNMDWQTSLTGLKPVFIHNNNLTYDFNMGENSFDGAAEYRNFEVKNVQYSSVEVEHIAQEEDGYHAYLRPDLSTSGKAYSTQTDLNGNWLVRNDVADDSHLEAEYIWVHFSLQMPEMFETDVWIEGRFNEFDEKKLACTYDAASGSYLCKALLKQGYYNYRYTTTDRFHPLRSVARTEGNYSQTENDYHVIVYMYDRNQGCDRIIGLKYDNSVR